MGLAEELASQQLLLTNNGSEILYFLEYILHAVKENIKNNIIQGKNAFSITPPSNF